MFLIIWAPQVIGLVCFSWVLVKLLEPQRELDTGITIDECLTREERLYTSAPAKSPWRGASSARELHLTHHYLTHGDAFGAVEPHLSIKSLNHQPEQGTGLNHPSERH